LTRLVGERFAKRSSETRAPIFDAVLGNDFNLALVALMLATLVTLTANLAADLAYAWLDPRIRYDGQS